MRRPPGWVTIKPNLMQIPVFVKWQDVRIGSNCDMPAQLGHVRFAPHTRSDPASSPRPRDASPVRRCGLVEVDGGQIKGTQPAVPPELRPNDIARTTRFGRETLAPFAVTGATVTERSMTVTKALLAGSIRIVSAAISSVSSGGTSTDCSGSDAYRHSTAYGCTTVDATAIDTTVVNANATNANASSVCEGVS